MSSLHNFSSKAAKVDIDSYFIFGAIFLVFCIGVYTLIYPLIRGLGDGNPACGKIVVAADGPTLDSTISASLNSAPYMLVIEPLSGKLLEANVNPFANIQANGADIAYYIAGKGEEAVITGSIDPVTYQVLTQFDVRTYAGYQGVIREVLQQYRQARLNYRPNAVPVQRAAPARNAPLMGGTPARNGTPPQAAPAAWPQNNSQPVPAQGKRGGICIIR
ncbi:MAG: NifB/NifX family molybdenum-iron cluster-binding protein [Planctomycetes bacterium]|nr:NifB/NifX family molybdenum-iron cluster-binding protein [Planctomycetota bacterium]